MYKHTYTNFRNPNNYRESGPYVVDLGNPTVSKINAVLLRDSTELILQPRVISKQFQYVTISVMVGVMWMYISCCLYCWGAGEGVHGRFH